MSRFGKRATHPGLNLFLAPDHGLVYDDFDVLQDEAFRLKVRTCPLLPLLYATKLNQSKKYSYDDGLFQPEATIPSQNLDYQACLSEAS